MDRLTIDFPRPSFLCFFDIFGPRFFRQLQCWVELQHASGSAVVMSSGIDFSETISSSYSAVGDWNHHGLSSSAFGSSVAFEWARNGCFQKESSSVHLRKIPSHLNILFTIVSSPLHATRNTMTIHHASNKAAIMRPIAPPPTDTSIASICYFYLPSAGDRESKNTRLG